MLSRLAGAPTRTSGAPGAGLAAGMIARLTNGAPSSAGAPSRERALTPPGSTATGPDRRGPAGIRNVQRMTPYVRPSRTVEYHGRLAAPIMPHRGRSSVLSRASQLYAKARVESLAASPTCS